MEGQSFQFYVRSFLLQKTEPQRNEQKKSIILSGTHFSALRWTSHPGDFEAFPFRIREKSPNVWGHSAKKPFVCAPVSLKANYSTCQINCSSCSSGSDPLTNQRPKEHSR